MSVAGEIKTVGLVRSFGDALPTPHTSPTLELARQYADALADPSHDGLTRCRELAPDLRGVLMADSFKDREAYGVMDIHLRRIEAIDPRAAANAIQKAEQDRAELEREIADLQSRLAGLTNTIVSERGKLGQADQSRGQLVTVSAMRPAAAFALQDRLRAAGVAVSLPEL